MPRAEAGTPKAISNQMRRKGLQRLRWYCQVCEKQCFDDNGFKMHTQSEGHVRNMAIVGENASKFINDYSGQFKSDFLKLLRTSHGEKPISINRFYNEYISDKNHVHMNATKWNSLTEFAKYLGREGICRVTEEEDEKGLTIAWIDNSPENLRRQDALRKRERQDKGDEQLEQKLINQQVKKAHEEAEAKRALQEADAAKEVPDEARELHRKEGEKVSLSIVAKPKPKNVFAEKKKSLSALAGKKSDKSAPKASEPPKKMSEAERIMREEMAAKRKRDGADDGDAKRVKT